MGKVATVTVPTKSVLYHSYLDGNTGRSHLSHVKINDTKLKCKYLIRYRDSILIFFYFRMSLINILIEVTCSILYQDLDRSFNNCILHNYYVEKLYWVLDATRYLEAIKVYYI